MCEPGLFPVRVLIILRDTPPHDGRCANHPARRIADRADSALSRPSRLQLGLNTHYTFKVHSAVKTVRIYRSRDALVQPPDPRLCKPACCRRRGAENGEPRSTVESVFEEA